MYSSEGVIFSKKTKLKTVPIRAVKLRDGFWKTKMELNHSRGLPRLLEHLEANHVVENFSVVSGRKQGKHQGRFFSDSDLFKWMEGAAHDLQTYDDAKAKATLDRIIDEVVAAQGEDGYLNTFFQGELFNQRFRNLPIEHELYCAGHLFQAAIAHYRATGEDKLLNCACRYADYLVNTFGYDKKQGVDGHPEVEMALIELFRTTGNTSYLELAEYFLTQLGYKNMPQIAGHAVRALYTTCAGADYFIESGDAEYKAKTDFLWNDLVSGKIYITGGVGSRYEQEAIGEKYELPNSRAYTETCAAIANVMWNFRMLQYYGDSKYSDWLETSLYNSVISGVGLNGVSYFYRNPLFDLKLHQRQEWWSCTCCPTNMVRMLASLPGYMYSISDEGVWAHLFDNSEINYQLADGTSFSIEQKTNYPWSGKIEFTIGLESAKEFTLFVRKPSWCQQHSVNIIGGSINNKDGYLAITKIWEPGEICEVNFEMPVMLMQADPRVREDYGSVAIQRGPLVFCAESPDNPDVSIVDLELASPKFDEKFENDLLGGVVTLLGMGLSADPQAERGPLYFPKRDQLKVPLSERPIKLIPYYAWANRGAADMCVWLPFKG